jgi:hypothetical protein
MKIVARRKGSIIFSVVEGDLPVAIFPVGGGWVVAGGGGGGGGVSTLLSTTSIRFKLPSATVFNSRIDSSNRVMLERLLDALSNSCFNNSLIPAPASPSSQTPP